MLKSLARRALRGALEVRKIAQVPVSAPISIYDLAAEKLKIRVRFHAGASFGGMYAKDTQTILVPTERPAGRRAFTCAHEVGHWYFEHGTRVENLTELEKGGADDPDEVLANQFAGHLLMSKWAIEKSFLARNLTPLTATDGDFYAIACQFGVGYETLITHLRFGLDLLPSHQADKLSQSSPKIIKQRLLDNTCLGHLVVVDAAWNQEIPIDLEVGDGVFLTFPAEAANARLKPVPLGKGWLFQATNTGISKVTSIGSAWSAFVRVSKKGFVGRSIYRHLEDPDA